VGDHLKKVKSGDPLERYREFFAPLKLQKNKHLWQTPFEEAVENRLPEILVG